MDKEQGLDDVEPEFFTIMSMDLEPVQVNVDVKTHSGKLASIYEDCRTQDDFVIETMFSKEVIEYGLEFCQLVAYDTVNDKQVKDLLYPLSKTRKVKDIIPNHILKKIREIRKLQLQQLRVIIGEDKPLDDRCRFFKRFTLFLEDFLMVNAMQWIVLYVSYISIENKYSPEIFLVFNPYPEYLHQWQRLIKFTRSSFVKILCELIQNLDPNFERAIEIAKDNRELTNEFYKQLNLTKYKNSTIQMKTRAMCRDLNLQSEEEFHEKLYLDFQRILKYYVAPWWLGITRASDVINKLS